MNNYALVVAGMIGFFATLILTGFLIPILKKAKAGQHIREEGPESHQKKAGTPSMGGIGIIVGVLLASFVINGGNLTSGWIVALAGILLFGLIGFVDDYIKIIKKQNLGLLAWQKFSLQMLIAVAFALYMKFWEGQGTEVFIPFLNQMVDFGGWYIPFIVFTILAMVNGINLTDGLDGLASGVTAIVAAFFVYAAYRLGAQPEAVIFAALIGACLGFLMFNRYPAKVFMGDTGSLALGGCVALTAIVMKLELFLPIVGIIYVLEALSVVLQVTVFKMTGGKRLFKMAPLHHHFEKSGMKETKVVFLFWMITFICCLGGMAIL